MRRRPEGTAQVQRGFAPWPSNVNPGTLSKEGRHFVYVGVGMRAGAAASVFAPGFVLVSAPVLEARIDQQSGIISAPAEGGNVSMTVKGSGERGYYADMPEWTTVQYAG